MSVLVFLPAKLLKIIEHCPLNIEKKHVESQKEFIIDWSVNKHTTLRWQTQHAVMANAARCVGECNTLR